MITLLSHLLTGFTQQPPLRRYHVTPRHNAHAFRRAVLREALSELKRDSAFAAPSTRRHS